MSTITDAATLRSLYAPIRENPYEKKAKIIASVMPESGFAKPLLAYVMGKELSGAEGWDKEREVAADTAQTASTKQAGEAAAQDYATKTMTQIFKVSEKDPVAATDMLRIEVEQGTNEHLKKFKGITFNAPSKDGWATVGSSDGYVYHTYLPNLQEAVAKGVDSDLYKQTVIKVGEGKPAPAVKDKPNMTEYDNFIKTRTSVLGQTNPQQEGESAGAYDARLNDIAIKEWQKFDKTKATDPHAAAKEQAKPAMLSQLSTTYTSKWLPLALENYRKQNPQAKDLDFLDPNGNIKEGTLRSALTPEQQGNYDRGLIEAQAAVGKGANPAQAVQDVLKKFQVAPVTPGNPGGTATPAAMPPAGFVDSGKTTGGKKVYVKGTQAWIAP